jgi:predicted dehydrogenase
MALQMSEVEEMVGSAGMPEWRLRSATNTASTRTSCMRPSWSRAATSAGWISARGNIKDSVANNGPHLLDTLRYVLGDRSARRVSATFERTGETMNRGHAGRERRARRDSV